MCLLPVQLGYQSAGVAGLLQFSAGANQHYQLLSVTHTISYTYTFRSTCSAEEVLRSQECSTEAILLLRGNDRISSKGRM